MAGKFSPILLFKAFSDNYAAKNNNLKLKRISFGPFRFLE